MHCQSHIMNYFISQFSRPLSSLGLVIVLAMWTPFHGSFAGGQETESINEPHAKKMLNKIMRNYYEHNAEYDPVSMTLNGDNRFDSQLGMSIAPRIRANHFKQYHKFRKQLDEIDVNKLDDKDRYNYSYLAYLVNSALAFEKFPAHMLPINQMESVPITLANFAHGNGSQPITTPEQYRAYLSRIAQLPAWINQAIVNMQEGMKMGVVQPKALITAVLPQFKRLVSSPAEQSVFYAPIRNLPTTFSARDKEKLTASYRAVIKKSLNPALIKLATFLETEYLNASRSSSGWSALPNGNEWYLAYVAKTTTTSLHPEQIHAIGLKEVARIQDQFAVLGPKLGYFGTAKDLPKWVATQKRFRPFKTDQEILDAFNQLNVHLGAKLPALFSLIPKAPLEIRLEPELTKATASSHYTSPNPDGSRPGIFWAAVSDPTQFDCTGITSIFLHEGRPGHHFQIALQQELQVPDFRKYGFNNAFAEGWALYAETLGRELGLYEDPEQYFGNLNFELLRAVRLVVDTGLHWNGWTREQSIQYMRTILGYSEAEARNAVERYMALPGQALSYKVGSMKIEELRQKASTKMGSRFDLPKFHAVILDEGNLPLTMLEEKVNRWIESAN